MKYSPQQYAEALHDSLEGEIGTKRVKILQRFDELLAKNRDGHLKNRILAQFEKIHLEKQGLRKVDVESAKPVSLETKEQLKKIIGDKILLTEKVNPDLVAGITILVDDSLYIDASARTRIQQLFVK
jgi:F0F1-type ATP synthase delta subunit